jgi:PBP1b-binding outer membrane lipoprotein LpoB
MKKIIIYTVLIISVISLSGCLSSNDASQSPIPVPYDINGEHPR